MKPSSISQPFDRFFFFFLNIVLKKISTFKSVVVLSIHDVERESHDALSVFYLGVTNKIKLFDFLKLSNFCVFEGLNG